MTKKEIRKWLNSQKKTETAHLGLMELIQYHKGIKQSKLELRIIHYLRRLVDKA